MCLSIYEPVKEHEIQWQTYSEGSAASARAAPLPLIPTVIPHTKLQPPTVMPAQKRAKPV
jgi:hypothetical protein